MATTATVQDFRRTDLRTNALENPYWISSAVVDAAVVAGLKDKACVLFSFPVTGQQIVIRDIAVQIITGLTALTAPVIGYGTIDGDTVTTGGHVDYAGATTDNYMTAANFTAITAGWYYPAAANVWLTDHAAGTHTAAAALIVGDATLVPVVTLTLATAAPIIGQIQLHMLIAVLPGT